LTFEESGSRFDIQLIQETRTGGGSHSFLSGNKPQGVKRETSANENIISQRLWDKQTERHEKGSRTRFFVISVGKPFLVKVFPTPLPKINKFIIQGGNNCKIPTLLQPKLKNSIIKFKPHSNKIRFIIK